MDMFGRTDQEGKFNFSLKNSNSYIEELAASLVQDYLHEKGLGVVKEIGERSLGSQQARTSITLLLVKKLDIETLWQINKNSLFPFKTVLEVILKFFSLNFNSHSAVTSASVTAPEQPITNSNENILHDNNNATKILKQSRHFHCKSDQVEKQCLSENTEEEKEQEATSDFQYHCHSLERKGSVDHKTDKNSFKILGGDTSSKNRRNLSLSQENCDLSKSSISTSTVNKPPNDYDYSCHNPSIHSPPLILNIIDDQIAEQTNTNNCHHSHQLRNQNNKTYNNTFSNSSNNLGLSEPNHHSNSSSSVLRRTRNRSTDKISINNNNNNCSNSPAVSYNYKLKSRGPKLLDFLNKSNQESINSSTNQDKCHNGNGTNKHLHSHSNSNSSSGQSFSLLLDSENKFLDPNQLVMNNVEVSNNSKPGSAAVDNNRFNTIRASQLHGNVALGATRGERDISSGTRRKITVNENISLKNDIRIVSSASSSNVPRNNADDERSNDYVEPLSPPLESPRHKEKKQGAADKFDFKVCRNNVVPGPGSHNKNRNHHHPRNENPVTKLSLAQSLLASKQNMLAEMTLTPEENSERKQSPNGADAGQMFESSLPSSHPSSALSYSATSSSKESSLFSRTSNHVSNGESDRTKMTLCDIEDEDFDFGDPGSGPRGDFEHVKADNKFTHSSYNSNAFQSTHSKHSNHQHEQVHKSLGMHSKGRESIRAMDVKTWRDLKMTVLGNNSILDGWVGQGFVFDHNIPYGLVQNKGGPCGVLAVVQALVLRNLIFGSSFCDDDELPLSEPITNSDPSTIQPRHKVKALVCALAEILWQCSHADDQEQGKGKEDAWSEFTTTQFTNRQNEETNSGGAIVCFSNVQVGSEMRVFDQEGDLRAFIQSNLQRFDCVSLVYSAVLSRGIENVQEDLDFPNSLLGSHGYCSQELVNLLSIGKAVSNVFDNEVALDEKILKGIKNRADIGFLSLFEHYDSCQVGSYLKTPKYPVWIVCSESHFSVLFSLNSDIIGDQTVENFDLYYFDGLARQQQQIKLTIEIVDGNKALNRKVHSYVGKSNNNNNNNWNEAEDDDLVPPLEKCIRTKWKNCHIDWNDTEPIL